MIYNLYKYPGETPLECIQRYRHKLMEDKSFDKAQDKWTYLGRLDPLAEGVLLAGTGEDVKEEKRKEFFNLDKEYEFTAIFGFATDTYDVLGKILRVENVGEINEINLIKLAEAYQGEREQKYPPFSSKMIASLGNLPQKVLGSALASTRLSSEDFPEKTINIYKMEFLGLHSVSPKELFGRLLMDISKVRGDFRQHDILTLWKTVLLGMQKTPDAKVFLGKFKASVSSGTYIRGIVNDFGNTLAFGATALNIKRISVGEYKVDESIK